MELDFGDVSAWVAAVVAIGAASIAIWQARSARRQADAAEEQATAARDQADAAKQQVELMQRERYDRRAPKFALVEAIDAIEEHGSFAAKLKFRMDAGPPLASVAVCVISHYVNHGEKAGLFHDVHPGHVHSISVLCDDGYVNSSGTLELVCTEEGGESSTWTVPLGFRIAPQPPPQRIRGQFNPQ